MARIIGIGETVYTIRMHDGEPQTGVPGGDIFETLIQLGREGADAALISEVGDDRLGRKTLDFMRRSGVKTDYMSVLSEGRTALCISHMEADGREDRDHYRLYPQAGRLDVVWPRIDPGDYLLFGGKYALEPPVSGVVNDIVGYAIDRKAVIVYDAGLQHLGHGENVMLMPHIIENYERADIVIMDDSDALQLYRTDNAARVFKEHIEFYAPVFLMMHASDTVSCITSTRAFNFESAGQSRSDIVAALIRSLASVGATKENVAAAIDPAIWQQ